MGIEGYALAAVLWAVWFAWDRRRTARWKALEEANDRLRKPQQ